LTDGSSVIVEEETLGVYGEVNYETELVGMPLMVNAGVRYVETDTTAVGASEGADGQIFPEVASSNYSNTLPSINLVWELSEELQTRFSWAKNVTRPGLSSLVPRVTGITVVNGNVSEGNPDLEPIESDSIDLGIEWYFAEESLLAFTWFTKDITGFIAPETVLGVLPPDIAAIVALEPEYDPTDPDFDPTARDPFTDPWNLERPVNAQDADVDGYEIIYQQPFVFLPGFWSNFGLIANYTHVESEAVFESGTISKVSSLPGLSEESYNLTLYYETDAWGARVSTNKRDDYVTQVSGSNGNVQEKNTGPTRVDLSAFYNVTDDISVRLEVINFNEEEERNYTTGINGNHNLVREFNSTGREVYLGIRVDFF
jgi:TonB-dependent receptor